MSWYNSDDTSFIDATQTFSGGGGSLEVTGGGGVDIQLSDLLELKLDHLENQYEASNPALALNLYLKNQNPGGEIRFYTEDAVNNNDVSNNKLTYNTKIGTDGKLYLYYTYNPVNSLFITSGWTDIVDYAVSTRNQVLAVVGNIATIDATLYTPVTGIAVTYPGTQALVATNTTSIIDHDARILRLELDAELENTQEEFKNALDSGVEQLREEFKGAIDGYLDMIKDAAYKGGNPANVILALKRARTNLGIGIFNGIIAVAGGISLVAGIAFGIYDRLNANRIDEEEIQLLNTYDKLKNYPDASVVNLIHKDGLSIQSSTNTGFTTPGTYEVNIANNCKIEIEIDSILSASIVDVTQTDIGFSVGDVISIPKSNLGGSTTGGNLDIDVVTLFSELQIIVKKIDEVELERQQLNNRVRRRQFIPDKNDFNNGLDITETNVTEPSGEITKSLDISLKLDTSQFQYDASGNLQIQNYGTIPVNPSQFQYTSGNLELINYSQIATNATDISTIQGNISTIQADQALQNTNITNNYNNIYSILNTQIPALQNSITTNLNNITTNTTDIATINTTISALPTQGNLTEIYQLILNDGETPTSSTNLKQVNIGFNKNEFDSIVFDLIMGAVKVSASVDTPFTITDFNNYFFGLYPNMRRLNYHDVITLVKQESTKYYNDTNWNSGGLVTKGAFYFKNEKTGEVYDLNKRFEYLGFHRFKTNVAGENTYIIRTALEYDEQQDVPPYALLKAYQVDLNRMSFYLRDGRFYFSHLCRYTLDYWGINFTRNILTDFLSPAATYTNAVPTYGNYEAYKRIFVVSQPNNEDIFFKIEDAYHPLSQTTFDSLIDTNPNSNPHFMGMLQNYDGTTYNHDPFGTLNTFIVSTNTLIHIARIEIEYKIMRWEAFNSTWFDDIPNTQAKVANLWEELVFEFYDTYTDTVPAQTILLDTRQIYTTSTNTIIIDFDKSPDLYSYLHKKWKIRPRFNSAYASGYPQTATNSTYRLTANQRSAFVLKVKLVPYVLKTLQREQVEEFTDGTQHTLSAFDYNKIYFYARLNNNSATPFNDIYYKLNDNLDANKYQITIPQTFYTSQLSDLTDLPPNVTQLETNSFNFLTDDFFVSPSQQTITLDNSILIIGDEDINVDQYQTHFNWRFLQSTDVDLTETNLDDYDYLKTYNYYHQTAKCDRFFSCREFYADMIDFKNIQIGGSLAYEEMDTGEFGTLSQASDGFTLKSLSSQNIQNLYGLTADGYVYYDTITGFTTNPIAGGYGDADVRLLLSTSMGDTMRYDTTNNKIIAEPDMLSIKNRAFDIFGNDIMRFTYTEPTPSTYNITLDRQHKSNLSANNRSIFFKTQFDEKEAVETFNFTESTPQFNSQGIGSGVSDSTGITFVWVSLGGDIIRYSGASQRWGVYWTDDTRALDGGDKTTMVIGDFTLLYMLNDGDDILCDPARYRIQSTSELWLIKDADIVEKIKLRIYFPDVYIHTFRTGYKISMEASDTAPNAISNVRDKVDLFYFNSSRVFHTAFEVADRTQYNPFPALLQGVPVQYNNDYRWAWKVNQMHVMNLYEEGSLFMTGNIFVKCAVGINRVEQGNQILVNSIENLSKNNITNTPITGIPPLVTQPPITPQVFTFNIDNITTSGGQAILTISGTDRVATYTGVLSTSFPEFHIYIDDIIKITLSQPAIDYLVFTFDCEIRIQNQQFDTFTLNQSTGLYEAFVSVIGTPYIQQYFTSSVIPQGQSAVVDNLIYYQSAGVQFNIDIRLTNPQVSYTNPAYNPTDVFTLNYYPYNNDYAWALNTAVSGYTDADVKLVLSNSAGTGLTWNSTTEEFDNSITQYADSDVKVVLSNSAGTGLTWNATTEEFDNTITQYADSDVRNVLSQSGSTNIGWDATNNLFQLSGFTAQQVVFGGGSGIVQSPTFTYNLFSQTLTSTNFSGNGSALTNINAGNITTGTLPITRGGTGATSASQARTALNVDIAGTDNSTDVTLASVANNYLTISGQQITAGLVPITLGGTGATTAAAARTALGVDASGTDNSTDVTLASVTDNYLTISGQQITAGIVPNTLGGTGTSDTLIKKHTSTDTQLFSQQHFSFYVNQSTDLAVRIFQNKNLKLFGQLNFSDNTFQSTAGIPLPANPVTNEYLKYDGTNWVSSAISGGGGSYTDADVRNVLSQSGSTNIAWDSVNNWFELAGFTAQQVVFGGGYGILQSANFTYNFFTQTLSVTNFSGNGSSLTNINAGNITTGTLPITRGGTGATNQAGACLNILPLATTGQYLKYDGTNWQGDTIIHYNDADTRDVISVSAGVNLVWNSVTKDLDVDLPITWTTPNLGIHNSSPAYPLDIIGTTYIRDELLIGTPSTTSDGYVELGKNNGSGGNRKMRLHFNSSFDMCMSDAGNSSTSSISTPFRVAYSAPNNCVHIQSSGLTYFASTGPSINQYGRLYSRWTNNWLTWSTSYYNIQTQSGIYVRNGRQLLLNSTRKIKKNITDLDDNECLDLCLKLRPKKYQMIDEVLHGKNWRYGYISEEVLEDYPEATETAPLTTPSVYKMADVVSEYIIRIENDLILNKKYTCYINAVEGQEPQMELTILEILENNEYRVDVSLDGLEEVFIYGYEEDTIVLKKDYFHPIHTSSIQQLHRIITQQQEQIDKQQQQIDTLIEILQRNGIN